MFVVLTFKYGKNLLVIDHIDCNLGNIHQLQLISMIAAVTETAANVSILALIAGEPAHVCKKETLRPPCNQ